MKKLIYGLSAFFMILSVSCSPHTQESTDVEEVEVIEKDWIILFDGNSAHGWRGFNKDGKLPAGWSIEDRSLKSIGTGGDIVYGAQEFENFELIVEWKISTAGNSGIFYHVQEGEQYHAPYQNAPEYQLLDDLGYPDPLEEWQKLASDYAMYPALATKPIKPAGEWNISKIIFTKEKVQYFLNGEKVVEFVPWSDDWHEKRLGGKWAEVEDYGKAKKGFIGLQEHPGSVWFRNIKIKEL